MTGGLEIFFTGFFIAIFVYQIILYFLYGRFRPHLWLALICIIFSWPVLMGRSDSVLYGFLPSPAFENTIEIALACVCAAAILFTLYVRDLFLEYAAWKPVAFIGIVSVLVCCSMVIPMPGAVRHVLPGIAYLLLLLSYLYAFYIMRGAWKAGRRNIAIFCVGVLLPLPFIIIQVFTRFKPIQLESAYLMEISVVLFLIFQVYMLIDRQAGSYKKLGISNRQLEKIVAERTGHLVKANSVKDRLLSVMSHDVKSPINSLRGILHLLSKGNLTPDEFSFFIQSVENDLSKTSVLFENILYWTTAQLKGLVVKKEEIELAPIIDENLKLLLPLSTNKKIIFTHNCPASFKLIADKGILNFVIRNYIANAIKFSREDNQIQISISRTNDTVLIQIQNAAIEIDQITLQTMMETEDTTMLTEPSVSGLDMVLCREYLEKTGGLIMIDSTTENGTTFSILLSTKSV